MPNYQLGGDRRARDPATERIWPRAGLPRDLGSAAGHSAGFLAAGRTTRAKTLARDHGVQLTSTKILPSHEAGPYLEVPVQVQFSNSIDQVLDILYHLEHHKKLLFVPEVAINALRTMKGEENGAFLQINLVVSGVTRKGLAS